MPFKVCAIRTECSDTSAVKQKKLRDSYGLSEGEIATVDLLASGKTPPTMIAEILSLKPTSVRQRLKGGVYEKTNVNGQVELIAFYGGGYSQNMFAVALDFCRWLNCPRS